MDTNVPSECKKYLLKGGTGVLEGRSLLPLAPTPCRRLYPSYLRILRHCLRKEMIAVWPVRPQQCFYSQQRLAGVFEFYAIVQSFELGLYVFHTIPFEDCLDGIQRSRSDEKACETHGTIHLYSSSPFET